MCGRCRQQVARGSSASRNLAGYVHAAHVTNGWHCLFAWLGEDSAYQPGLSQPLLYTQHDPPPMLPQTHPIVPPSAGLPPSACMPGYGGPSCQPCANSTWSAGGLLGDPTPACTSCPPGAHACMSPHMFDDRALQLDTRIQLQVSTSRCMQLWGPARASCEDGKGYHMHCGGVGRDALLAPPTLANPNEQR